MKTETYTLITGASSGIGAELAKQSAGRGNNVLIVALEDQNLYEIKDHITKSYSVKCEVFGINFSLPDAPQKVIQWVAQNDFKVNVLINNAGIGSKNSFENLSAEFYQKQLQLNIINMVLLTRLMLPVLKENKPSYVLNLGSLGGFFSVPEKSTYTASKAFVYSFSKSLFYELRKENISVSVICPGGVNSNENTIKMNRKLKYIGRKSIFETEEIAEIALKGMYSKKAVIIPGKLNKTFHWLNIFIPAKIKDSLILREFSRTSQIRY